MFKTHTIAMWSGPRNLSTAMMRAWENRRDTVVWDEPLYAHYLAQTNRPDPMAEEIMQSGLIDWHATIKKLCTPPAQGLQYQKHITSHVLPSHSLDRLTEVPGTKHVFLIREPERVVASFNRLLTATDEEELIDHIGFHQQQRIFEAVCNKTHRTPTVIDSTRFLNSPKEQLQTLCKTLSIPFDQAMLSWPPGLRDSDGVWASHWYSTVSKSTGFAQPPNTTPTLTDSQQRVADLCKKAYQSLLDHAL